MNIWVNYQKTAIEPVVSLYDSMAGRGALDIAVRKFLSPGRTFPLHMGQFAQQDFPVIRFSRWQYSLAALLCLAAEMVRAQQVSTSPHYTVQRWEAGAAEDGLPQNTVTAIIQTRDCYLWIGTYSGLARFDGLRFTVFDNNKTPGLASSRVTSLFEADDGTLWIGHEGGEVSSYRQGQFQAAKMTANWSGGKIQELATDAAGDVWLLNGDGLLARLRDGLVLTPESGDAARVVQLTRSRSGKIWVGRNGRISELRGGRLIPLPFTEAWTNRYVTGIGVSRDDGLWVIAGEQARKWKDPVWGEELGGVPWPYKPFLKVIETQSGALAVSSSDIGLALIRGGNEPPLVFNRTNGFPSDWVTALCEDREGNLWVGTGGAGLAVLRRGVLQTVTAPDEWLGRAVLSVYPGHDGSLWIGTEGAGLYQLREDHWKRFGEEAGINAPYVWSVIEDARDRLWIGTWNGGLLARQGDRFAIAPGMETMTEPVTALLRAHEGGLWLGTGAGLMRHDAGKCQWPGQGENSTRGDVRTIAEARDGTVWFGTSGRGLGRLKDGQVQWFHKANGLASEYIGSLYFEDDDTLWIGTLGGGLNRFKHDRFTSIGVEQGLPNGFISHIEDDGLGFFWMSSHNGLIRVAKSALNAGADGATQDVHFRTYGLSDGLPTLKCSSGLQAAGCKTADGRLWFSTSRGLVAVTPGNVRTNLLPPPVVVEQMLLDEKPVPFTNNAALPLRIPPGRHRIDFQYSGLSFIASERIQFKHRLENWENDWVNSGVKRAVNYSYLPPGDYAFEVSARNNDGVWSEHQARIGFTILPFFWQTLWFRGAAGMVLVAGAAGIVWFYTRRRMRRKLEQLERQRAIENERARIAKDIHDDLGSTLTRITMLSDPARGAVEEIPSTVGDLNQIHTTARELTRSMDEIVWAINPQHDTVESLIAYLENFAQDFLGTARVRCRLDVPLQFPVLALTAEARHNLFLAFKEALHNVVKHSGATEVRIIAGLNPTEFTLMLEDNGGGFSLAEAGRKGFGNGLANMRRRLRKIGGQCEIEPIPGKGTKVTFIVKLAPASF
jgi:signal transduction histidine kinase/ligand-binding sensor domain-containing protein